MPALCKQIGIPPSLDCLTSTGRRKINRKQIRKEANGLGIANLSITLQEGFSLICLYGKKLQEALHNGMPCGSSSLMQESPIFHGGQKNHPCGINLQSFSKFLSNYFINKPIVRISSSGLENCWSLGVEPMESTFQCSHFFQGK